jgi:hypothetical protein
VVQRDGVRESVGHGIDDHHTARVTDIIRTCHVEGPGDGVERLKNCEKLGSALERGKYFSSSFVSSRSSSSCINVSALVASRSLPRGYSMIETIWEGSGGKSTLGNSVDLAR